MNDELQIGLITIRLSARAKRKNMKSSQNIVNANLNFDEDSLKGDYSNVALLVLLYMMQGVISGIGYALPLILLNKGNTYEDQAIFSLANYPFTGECGVVGELDNL